MRPLWLLQALLLASAALGQLLDHRAHVFNSVSSALRQWGNTLNPNGASFVPGVIRAGTSMYHARIWPLAPGTPEWLAFDAEMSFGIFGNGGRFPGANGTLDTWMRTYSARRDIKVAYFDGMSAMIATTGTFDFVDLVGFGLDGTPLGDWRGVWDEYARAAKLCNWTRENAVDLDGFVRMNAGFELIVCDWASWELVANVNVTRTHQDISEPFYEWARSAAWHNFVTDSRVEIDWSGFVSAHGRDVLLDPKSSTKERRMLSMSNETKMAIRDEVLEVSNRPLFEKRGINWQTLADTITTRYAPRLLQIQSILSGTSPNATEISAAASLVHIALVPYYDPTLADLGLHKCINGLTWHVQRDSLTREEAKIYDSVIYVLERICGTLYDLFDMLPSASPYPALHAPNSTISDASALVTMLFEDLAWPGFVTCPPGACSDAVGAFCSLAVWPIIWGGAGQEWPRCLSRADFDWRNRRPPGRGPGGGGKRPGGGGGPGGPGGPGGGGGGGGGPGGPGGDRPPPRDAPGDGGPHDQVAFLTLEQGPPTDDEDWVWWPEHYEL
ncbi:hypothetical protein CALCODRAFT_493756 [Calocera cornea HHB12733]|uniref:Uncharacterized protein n=1 Tax=Calocera cornea HHB12733 TaxID=1353952 RepID=A0A165HK94_9BASI|nr:hypothetical protein CALCODRAFT_493756 [Calocera cornea HHB12733]